MPFEAVLQKQRPRFRAAFIFDSTSLLRLHFRSGQRIDDHELFMMERRVGLERQAAGIPALDLDEQLLVLRPQTGEQVRAYRHLELVQIGVFLHYLVQRPLQLDAH
jgi:hypothetical protein